MVASRLMQAGEVALWRDGVLVWCGPVGSIIADMLFDSIAVNVRGEPRLRQLVGSRADCVTVCAAIARWWDLESVVATKLPRI